MVNFVCEVETMPLHIQPLYNLRIVVTANMEITRHFVNEYETAQFATLTII